MTTIDSIDAIQQHQDVHPGSSAPASAATNEIWIESIGGDNKRAWVAQITGVDAKGRLMRTFLRGVRDYSRANSAGSRGIWTSYQLQPGVVYEISSPTSWSSTDRYFARIVDGARHRMTIQDVRARLADA